jgi:hypothetical protein
MTIEVRDIQLGLDGDTPGVLFLRDGALIAVLSYLGPSCEDEAGLWRVEASFTGDASHPVQWFADLDAACRHFERRSTMTRQPWRSMR